MKILIFFSFFNWFSQYFQSIKSIEFKPVPIIRTIYGQIETTPDCHNVYWHQGCESLGDNKWCVMATTLTVRAPNSQWIFDGNPWIECVKDNDGSCNWNQLGGSDRYFIMTNNPDLITVKIITGSKPIQVRIACKAEFYP